MRLKILLPAVFFILTAKAQDTLVLTPSMAVSMALENNNAAKNSTLMLSAASAEKWSAIQINPAEMIYRYGHLYSDDNSRYLQISQNIGSLPEHIIGINLSRAELDKASAEATIRKKELVSNVKSAYYRWIYQHSMVKLLSDRQKTLMELAIYFEPDTESTTSNTIRYYEIESLLAEAETDLVCRIADMEIAANELRMLIVNNDELMPSMNNLTLYQVERISDTATYSGASLINYYREALNVSSIKTKLKKSAFFPDITIGLINQKIQPFSNLWAWQVGLQIPLIFANEAANTKKAVLNEKIALNNLESSLFHTEKEIENLLIELDKHFRKIIYYDRYSLPRGENEEKIARESFINKKIPFSDYLSTITAFHKVKADYFETVDLYNQVAIKLEFYIN